MSAARILVLTRRRWYRLVSAGAMLDLENAAAGVGPADLLHLPRYVGRRETLRTGRRTPRVAVEGSYDACLLALFQPGEIACLRSVPGLRQACGRVLVYVFDAWAGQAAALGRHRRLWNLCDHVFVSFPGAVEPYRAALCRPVSYLPQAIEPARFRPRGEARPIDVLSVGRRLEPVHRRLVDAAERHDLWYQFSESRAPEAIDLDESQLLLGRLCRSSRSQICWPVEITHAVRPRHGYSPADGSPVTARWFEAAASGSIVIGARPGGAEFGELFPYADFVRELDPHADGLVERRVLELLDGAEADEAERAHLARHVCEEHCWRARCRRMLELAA